MKKINSIVIITAGYPTPVDTQPLTFLDQLACTWADVGINVTVICPIPRGIELKDKSKYYKSHWTRNSKTGNKVEVFHPRFWGFGKLEERNKLAYRLSYKSFQNSIIRIFDELSYTPDVLYSHFLTSGRHAADLSSIYKIKAFCAFGESSLWSVNRFNYNQTKECIAKLYGIIAVSSENRNVLIDAGLCDSRKICVIPNAIDEQLFFPRNKCEMRKKYNFPEKKAIGVFVGAFSERKGTIRAQKAAILANLQMIYIGDGEESPEGDNILFKGKVSHDLVPEYLSAADFFVLPTRAEGCSNAILEAMACGLPIISSTGKYNDDILNDSYSIRVNPDDIDQIQLAMELLMTNIEKKNEMSQAAYNASKGFTLLARARRILDFMNL